ncbi:MAG: hypothetical protein AAFR88_03490 [Pseudomonadota bacterium]
MTDDEILATYSELSHAPLNKLYGRGDVGELPEEEQHDDALITYKCNVVRAFKAKFGTDSRYLVSLSGPNHVLHLFVGFQPIGSPFTELVVSGVRVDGFADEKTIRWLGACATIDRRGLIRRSLKALNIAIRIPPFNFLSILFGIIGGLVEHWSYLPIAIGGYYGGSVLVYHAVSGFRRLARMGWWWSFSDMQEQRRHANDAGTVFYDQEQSAVRRVLSRSLTDSVGRGARVTDSVQPAGGSI